MIIGVAGMIGAVGAIMMDGAVTADLQVIESGASSAAFFRLQQSLWERAC
jgi:hypothetical protein